MMDPDIEALIAALPDANRTQLAQNFGAWAVENGVEPTEDLAEHYVRETMAAGQGSDHSEPEPEPEQEFFANYADRHQAQAEQANRDRLAGEQAEQDAAQFERQLGRTMLESERERLADAQLAQHRRGESLNIHGAAWDAGVKGWSEMSEDEITSTMEARQRELAGVSDPDITVPIRSSPVDGSREVDWGEMSTDQQNAYMAARLAGGQLEDGD